MDLPDVGDQVMSGDWKNGTPNSGTNGTQAERQSSFLVKPMADDAHGGSKDSPG
jgi:hypothetical protein